MNRKETFRLELVENLITFVTAVFGFVAGLAWNDAIQELFKRFVPSINTLSAKFIYAIVATLIVVLATYLLSRLARRLRDRA